MAALRSMPDQDDTVLFSLNNNIDPFTVFDLLESTPDEVLDEADTTVFFGSVITSPEKRIAARLEAQLSLNNLEMSLENKENQEATPKADKGSKGRKSKSKSKGRRDTVIVRLRSSQSTVEVPETTRREAEDFERAYRAIRFALI